MIYEFENNEYRAGEWDSSALDYVEVPGLPIRRTTLPDELRLLDVETALDGLVDEGRALTRFIPQGYVTQTWIHMEDGDRQQYTVIVDALGRAEIVHERIDAK